MSQVQEISNQIQIHKLAEGSASTPQEEAYLSATLQKLALDLEDLQAIKTKVAYYREMMSQNDEVF